MNQVNQVNQDSPHPFIGYLCGLRDREERGILAELRRGLGQPPGSTVGMFPYVAPWLPERSSARREQAYFLVASLFAYHAAPGGSGNLGAAFARARKAQSDDTAIERRFTALLGAHPDDLPVYLRQAVGFLRAQDVPIDWNQLFSDLLAWDDPRGYVQQNWARSFWTRTPTAATAPSARP